MRVGLLIVRDFRNWVEDNKKDNLEDLMTLSRLTEIVCWWEEYKEKNTHQSANE